MFATRRANRHGGTWARLEDQLLPLENRVLHRGGDKLFEGDSPVVEDVDLLQVTQLADAPEVGVLRYIGRLQRIAQLHTKQIYET